MPVTDRRKVSRVKSRRNACRRQFDPTARTVRRRVHPLHLEDSNIDSGVFSPGDLSLARSEAWKLAMAMAFPYTFVSCPCSDASTRALKSKRSSRDVDYEEIQDGEQTFDPRNPRSAFSLFPPEHLLYCEECHEIKCPRCVTEEINATYCPDCLFESPKAMVRGEGNRCPRNCFHCPVCTSQMITASVGDSKNGPFILNCNYCMWSTLDVGIRLDKSTGVRGQLDVIANGGAKRPALLRASSTYQDDPGRKSSLSRPPLSHNEVADRSGTTEPSDLETPLDATTRFNTLKAFYKDQIAESSATDAGFPASALDMAYSSPSSLQRIMNIYTNRENTLKRARQKLTVMREARVSGEGLQLQDPSPSAPCEYDETTTSLQREYQYPSFVGNPQARTVADLGPMPTLMRTKRSKRCATCKHILTRPEMKISSARYRIKLIALSYIPFVSLKPLPVSGGVLPPGPDGGDVVLSPGKAVQFIMTLRNPLFDDVNVSLGSPSLTPGKHGHRITILCPQFQIGKNSDALDYTLTTIPKQTLAGDQPNTAGDQPNTAGGEQIAGKLYDQGRNWASVVIEIVPASILRNQTEELDEDEDVIEIPIRVRLEWKVTEDEDAGVVERRRKEREKVLDEGEEADDGKRELSYWMVLGVGRVAC